MGDTYIYLHYRNDTGSVFYVGLGTGKRAYWMHKRNSYWTSIVKKYGYTVDIVAKNLSRDRASIIEKQLISAYLSCGSKLSNMTSGGETGFIFSESALKKLSQSRKIRFNTESEKIKQTNKLNAVRHLSIKKMSKPVVCLNTNETFDSITAAAAFYGVSYESMRGHLASRWKTCAGLVFAFAKNKESKEAAEKFAATPHGLCCGVACNETGETWNSLNECSLFFGGDKSKLSDHLAGRRRTFRGKTFKKI